MNHDNCLVCEDYMELFDYCVKEEEQCIKILNCPKTKFHRGRDYMGYFWEGSNIWYRFSDGRETLVGTHFKTNTIER